MFELWLAETGGKLQPAGQYDTLDSCWSWFISLLWAVKKRDQGAFIELRRPDGSAFARCTVQLTSAPDPGNGSLHPESGSPQ